MTAESVTAESLLKLLAAADDAVATKTGELKQAKEEYEALKDRVFVLLDEQGITGMESPRAGLKVSINETSKYGFDDFEAFVAFLLRNKAVELLHRRLADNAVTAMIEQRRGKAIPGVKEFKLRRLHVTKSKSPGA